VHRKRKISGRKNQQGVIITLVAVFMLFVIGAMAALSIDVVTLYTARSEAQLAADGAALAAARVLANSGATSDAGLLASAEIPAAKNVAIYVAEQNQVGGTYLTAANIVSVVFGGSDTNPTVTVKVQKTDLPTFFARIWGTKFVTVGASATAEAYNPSGTNALGQPTIPVAPSCVKPWLLPNIDPTNAANPIFDRNTGAISNAALLGSTPTGFATRLRPRCTTGANCSAAPLLAPTAWRYYPGNPASFPAPTQALPTCAPVLTTPYEESIAGCVQTPIACNAQVQIDNTPFTTFARETEAADAVNCLTHATAGADTVTSTAPPSAPFEFVAGAGNPIPGESGNDVMVSDSLVTVPVYDVGPPGPPPYPSPSLPPGTVTIVGFVQLFLNPDGVATPNFGANNGRVNTNIINMAGCGTGAAAVPPILGNGASPVAVRLISPP